MADGNTSTGRIEKEKGRRGKEKKKGIPHVTGGLI
jgi:hypothetical protein